MKKISLLTSFAAMASLMPASLILIAGCAKSEQKDPRDHTDDEKIDKVEIPTIEIGKSFSINVFLKDGYVVDGFNSEITIGDKVLKYTDCDFDIQNNANSSTATIIINKNVVTSTNIATKFVSMEKPSEEHFIQTSNLVGIIELQTQLTWSSKMIFKELKIIDVKGVEPFSCNHVESAMINGKTKFYVAVLFTDYQKSFLTNFTVALSYEKNGELITENFKNITFKYNHDGKLPISTLPKEFIYDPYWLPIPFVSSPIEENVMTLSTLEVHHVQINDPSIAEVQTDSAVSHLRLKKTGTLNITVNPEPGSAFSPTSYTVNIIPPKISLTGSSFIGDDEISQGLSLDCFGTGGEVEPTLVLGNYNLSNAYIEKMSLDYESNEWKFKIWGGLINKQSDGTILFSTIVQDKYQSVVGYIQYHIDIAANPESKK